MTIALCLAAVLSQVATGIGALGVSGESAKIPIGKQETQNATFVVGIYNANQPSSGTGPINTVYINSNGQMSCSF